MIATCGAIVRDHSCQDAQQALSHAAHAMDCSEELSEPEGMISGTI